MSMDYERHAHDPFARQPVRVRRATRVYSLDYVADEERAHRAGLRLWSWSFEMPWDWRQQRQHK
jgi:endonuclease YncB( thermonuclease family)